MGKSENSLPLQGAQSLASDCRYAGGQHAAQNPCYTSNIDLSFSIFCLAAKASTHGNCGKSKSKQPQSQKQPKHDVSATGVFIF
ncbi:hypothetical protein [Undibacterium sp.]|uniref:hypothetical protein n=1 Tax=Undibacterium sp. TaxID=1914977 RepID=UPI0027314679|nr:hypothetical protein [Undibacterium sp.]MDP1978473.1 hypothetical protein [Undibacterium sp.]